MKKTFGKKTSPLFSMTSTPKAEFLPHPWTIGCYAPAETEPMRDANLVSTVQKK